MPAAAGHAIADSNCNDVSVVTAPARVQLYRPRDGRILELARSMPRGDFAAAIDALSRAVQAVIPAGRVWLLGSGRHGPVVGSLISGIGITPGPGGRIQLVHLRDGLLTELEEL